MFASRREHSMCKATSAIVQPSFSWPLHHAPGFWIFKIKFHWYLVYMRILILCLQLSAVECWVQDLPAKSFGILPSAAHKFLAVFCTLLFAPEGFFSRTGERWSKRWIQLIFGYVLVGCQRKLWLQGFGRNSFWSTEKGDGSNNATKALGLIFQGVDWNLSEPPSAVVWSCFKATHRWLGVLSTWCA